MRTPKPIRKTLKPAAAQKQTARKRAAARRRREQALHDARAKGMSGAGGMPPAAVSVVEFRRLVGVSHATVSRWVRDGVIKSAKVGRRRFISFSEIARMKGE
jgi:excisionase family DNA binding protein